MGTASSEIVDTMKAALRLKRNEVEKGSEKAVLLERMHRTFLAHFQNKVLDPAKLLYEVPTVIMII